MAHWYQNVLTGEQREVKTLDDDDFYVENVANWARIVAPSPEPQLDQPVPEPSNEPEQTPTPEPSLVQPGEAWESTGGVVTLPIAEPAKPKKPAAEKRA